MTSVPYADYKIHCLEKENERLIESVKQARQNALALVAALLFITSGVLNIAKPLVSDLNHVRYDGSFQEFFIGEQHSEKRSAAVPYVTVLWNLASLLTVLGTAIAILFAVRIFIKSGRYAPLLDKATPETISANDYLKFLTGQSEGLRKLHDSYRRSQTSAAISALFAVAGCGMLTLLWLCFGGSS